MSTSMKYHVVIDKRTTLLYKSSNSKCEVFNWSLADGSTKFREPKFLWTFFLGQMSQILIHMTPESKQKLKQKDKIWINHWLLAIALATIWQKTTFPKRKGKDKKLPATPSFSPHHRLVRFVCRKCITIETIACIDLLKQVKLFKNWFQKTDKIVATV